MKKICFVCLGNICRSPMAEFVFKDLVNKNGLMKEFIIESRGTSSNEKGNDMYYLTKEKLSEKGIPFTLHKSTPLKKEDYDSFDYFIGMDMMNVQNMIKIFNGDREHKVFRFLDITTLRRDISDPWYTRDFEQTYKDIVTGSEALLKKF